MTELQNIKATISSLSYEEALQWLDNQLENNGAHDDMAEDVDPRRAALLAEKGKLLWRHGHRAEAITAYETSARLDPDGPGTTLLAHTREVMDFFNPDLLNP